MQTFIALWLIIGAATAIGITPHIRITKNPKDDDSGRVALTLSDTMVAWIVCLALAPVLWVAFAIRTWKGK